MSAVLENKSALPGEPPTRFFVRFMKKPAALAPTVLSSLPRLTLASNPIPFAIELKTPASLENWFGEAHWSTAALAAAIGQASEIARREGVTVELYERVHIFEITGQYDQTRSWDWRQELRAVEEP